MEDAKLKAPGPDIRQVTPEFVESLATAAVMEIICPSSTVCVVPGVRDSEILLVLPPQPERMIAVRMIAGNRIRAAERRSHVSFRAVSNFYWVCSFIPDMNVMLRFGRRWRQVLARRAGTLSLNRLLFHALSCPLLEVSEWLVQGCLLSKRTTGNLSW